MRRPRFVLISCAVLCMLPAYCAYGFVTFERNYGGLVHEDGLYVVQTADGGYALVGVRDRYGPNPDLYLVRTDSLGQTMWERLYGGEASDAANCVERTSSGGLIIVGVTHSFGAGQGDVYLIKTDSLGNVIWLKTYGGTENDVGTRVRPTLDGGYIVLGITDSYGEGAGDFYLTKTDSAGQELWSEAYGGPGFDFGYSVQQTTDNGFIAVGYTNSFGAGYYDFYIVKTDSLGIVEWTRTYGGGSSDGARSVLEDPSGGYVVAGWSISYGPGGYDFYLLKIDSSGDSVWAQTYGGTGGDLAYGVQRTSDGGYVIGGSTNSYGSGHHDAFLVKTDSLGNVAWTRTYGGTSWDYCYAVQQTADGGFVMVGTTLSYCSGGADMYLVKTDADGVVWKCESIYPPDVRSQGYWRRQCKDDSHEDICPYADSVHILADVFDAYDCDSVCDLMEVRPPERDMCRKAKRQFMTLLLNVASGKLALCNCLEDSREVAEVLAEIDSLLSGEPDFRTCEYAKTLADNLNNGIGIVPCDTLWVQAPPKVVQPPSVSVAPNPFARSTVIEYEVKTRGGVRLEIYDKAGRSVRTLVDTEQPIGPHRVEWDGLDSSSRPVPAGIYFTRLELGSSISSTKLVLLR